MKRILLYFNIALAAFFLNTFAAQDIQHEFGFKAVQHEYGFHYYQSHDEKLLLDACLEDISDDNLTEYEKKKVSSKKTLGYNFSSIAQNFSDCYLKKIQLTKLFFPLKTSLYIFIGVFRL